jgi:hypothetical protein
MRVLGFLQVRVADHWFLEESYVAKVPDQLIPVVVTLTGMSLVILSPPILTALEEPLVEFKPFVLLGRFGPG